MVARGTSEYKRIERDAYETPEWVTRALLPYIPKGTRIWEPACGSGKMAQVLKAAYASDLVTTYGVSNTDFLEMDKMPARTNAIITNPPYNRVAEQFIAHAFKLLAPVPNAFLAFLLPVDFDSARTRSTFFESSWFVGKIILTSRIVWVEREGASPASNHAWFLWDRKHCGDPRLYYYYVRG